MTGPGPDRTGPDRTGLRGGGPLREEALPVAQALCPGALAQGTVLLVNIEANVFFLK